MAGTLIDRAAAAAVRHERALTIAGAIWFWAGIAVYARFVDLPALVPEAWRPWFFWLSVAVNAAWWGFVHPQAVRRRAALEGAAGAGAGAQAEEGRP